MAWFEVSDSSEAVVKGPRKDVWAVLTDPDDLVEMTPLLTDITVDGDHWEWHLGAIKTVGQRLMPRFTEAMTFTDGEKIAFRHDPPEGKDEISGVDGSYTLTDTDDGGTNVAIDFTVRVKLPLPSAAGIGVRTAMRGVLARMGSGFASNLRKRVEG